MGSVPAHALGAALRSHLLAYMALVGGLRAMWRHYTSIVPSLFETTRWVVRWL